MFFTRYYCLFFLFRNFDFETTLCIFAETSYTTEHDIIELNNLLISNLMIKQEYETPSSEVLEVKFEGVICQSGFGDRSDYTTDPSNPFGL